MAMTKVRRMERESALSNCINRQTNITVLYQLGMARRKWGGLPETFDEWFMNRTLLIDGECLWFIDPDIGPLCLPVGRYGPIDVYGRPTGYYVWGMNGYHRLVPASEGVRVFENESRVGSLPLIEKTSEMMTELDNAMRTNINTSKFPFLIQCTEEQRKSINIMLNNVISDAPWIFGDKDLDAKAIKVFQTGASLQTVNFQQAKENIFTFALNTLGYESFQSSKRERLVSAETTSNYGFIEAMRKSCIDPVNRAIKEAQRKAETDPRWEWAFDVTCEFNSDLASAVNMPELEILDKTGKIETLEGEVDLNETV